jgi:Fe-S cluster assembly iron-binding protein IscA
MIKISERAAEKLKEKIAGHSSPEKTMLRVSFGGFG